MTRQEFEIQLQRDIRIVIFFLKLGFIILALWGIGMFAAIARLNF